MNTPLKNLILTASLLASGNCIADWTGGIEAGTTIGSGSKPSLRFYADSQSEPLGHYAYLDWAGDNYRVGYNPTFRISHSVYSFGRFSVEEDNPGDIDREIDALVGIGNNLFKRGNTQVKVETGIGGRALSFDNNTDDSKEGFVFLSGNVSSSLLSLVRFDAALVTKAGDGQTTIDGEAGISIPIGPGTSLRYVYSVKQYDIDGQPKIKSDDGAFRITYGF